MRDTRPGEQLWMPWDGDDSFTLYEEGDREIYYTVGHIDIEHEVVRRALASTLQRDGLSDSLADGFRSLENCVVSEGYAGVIDGEMFLSTCDESGMTQYGDKVDEVILITWVQV